ncbi:ATP-binding protein [Tichowtungia aerotolerans]|uniref:histidine kinase n=1 Tax=Tichowtungia aerotolerans TaxID=2697043 RepID=A0A6P1MEZ8_9BACT|nr:ATP-binding protein [Tichowtungia aerotolerans]QHI69655.1 PAS domain-containing protein [Tichowtungia aerotolerans]
MSAALPTSIIYTQDEVLLQRFRGYLYARASLQQVTDPDELELILHQHSSTLLFVDLCGTESQRLIEEIRTDFPFVLIVALGSARSEPALRVASLNIYAIESVDPGRLRLQGLFDQAQAHLKLKHENRVLKENLQSVPAAPVGPPRENIAPSLHHFSSAFRRFDNVGIMLESIVEGVAACARVSRVAIFSLTSDDVYVFRSGIKCMEETRSLKLGKTHPFVRWFQVHAHSISRSMLRHIESMDERLLIEQMLEQTGAEVILPLFGRERLNGWLCLGRSCSGAPFEQRDIEELTQLAEQVSVAIENSLLHENIALQKALAENLLQAIPVGIIATGPEGTVRWFNSGAEQLLLRSSEDVIGRPIEKVSTVIASLMNRCMTGENCGEGQEWTEPSSKRTLSIQTRRLAQNGVCMGAMAVLNDLTEEHILREKQNNLERAKFWNELAAAISHEVRNPLVAISTFAQLLPERYSDEEFREQFQELATQEVGRLNGMIDQLDEYANPPTLYFSSVDVAELLDHSVHNARRRGETSDTPVQIQTEPGLPNIYGDSDVLADSVSRLLLNAFTAVEKSASPKITLRASRGEIGIARLAVVIEVVDNGIGIPEGLQPKVFSPFCTTKVRGIGLGLPIVRRTMIDHGGLLSIESSASGTVVSLTLPAATQSVGVAS